MVRRREIVVIVGMHRSGTSVLARSINLLGFHLGKKVLPPANDNPNGFWENDRIVKVNDSILKKLGSGWADYCALPENWEQLSCLDEERENIAHLLDSEFEGSDKILIKDPRLCRTCKLWFPILEKMGFECKIVRTIRHPLEVAESLVRRNSDVHPSERLSKDEAVLLWIRYVYESVVNTKNYLERTFFFPDFLEFGEDLFSSLASFLAPQMADSENTKVLVLKNFSAQKKKLPLFPGDSELSKIALSIWDRVETNRRGIETVRLRPENLDTEIVDIHKTDALFGEIYRGWKSRTASPFSMQSKIEAPGQILRKISSRLINR